MLLYNIIVLTTVPQKKKKKKTNFISNITIQQPFYYVASSLDVK